MSKYPRSALAEAARESSSLVDLMRRVGAPMGSKPYNYLRHRLVHYGIDTSHFQEEALPERPKRSYAKEVLEEAASRSTSIREMFLHLGIPPEDGPYQHVKRRLAHFGIDISHFAPPRASRCEDLLPERELTAAVAASHSLADLMRRLGFDAYNGAARARAARSIDEYGLSTEHFVGQGHYAGVRSPRRKHADEILVLQGRARAARVRTCCAARSTRSARHARAPNVIRASCGTGRGWSWRSTTSMPTRWTTAGKTSGTCALTAMR